MEGIKIENIVAGDIMSENYEKIDISTSIADALKIFRNKKRVCFVFDKKDYKGIVTERSIVRSRFDPKHHNIGSVVVNTPMVDIDESVFKTAEKMIQTKMRFLPVLKDNKVVGCINNELFFEKLKNTPVAKEKLSSVMTEDLIYADEKTPISTVMNMMRENNVSRILTRDEKEEVSGIVALHDVITKVVYPSDRIARGEIVDEKMKSLSSPVLDIATYPLITLKSTESLENAANLFLKKHISSVLIIDKEDKIIGIVTITDLYEAILKNKPAAEDSMKYVLSLSGVDKETIDRELIEKKMSGLVRKYGSYLGIGSVLFVYAKEHSSTNSHVRMRLASKRGVFISTSQNKGFQYDFSKAVNRMEEQIDKKKERNN